MGRRPAMDIRRLFHRLGRTAQVRKGGAGGQVKPVVTNCEVNGPRPVRPPNQDPLGFSADIRAT